MADTTKVEPVVWDFLVMMTGWLFLYFLYRKNLPEDVNSALQRTGDGHRGIRSGLSAGNSQKLVRVRPGRQLTSLCAPIYVHRRGASRFFREPFRPSQPDLEERAQPFKKAVITL